MRLFYKGDQAHAGFDNVAFLSENLITFVEDAGDTLHTQRNALDSGFVLRRDEGLLETGDQPVRWLAEGRDASATLDADNAGFGKNDGDNEITGIHVSDGDPNRTALLGATVPDLRDERRRLAGVLHAAARRQPHLGGREAVNHYRSAGGRCEAGSRPPGYAAPR